MPEHPGLPKKYETIEKRIRRLQRTASGWEGEVITRTSKLNDAIEQRDYWFALLTDLEDLYELSKEK